MTSSFTTSVFEVDVSIQWSFEDAVDPAGNEEPRGKSKHDAWHADNVGRGCFFVDPHAAKDPADQKRCVDGDLLRTHEPPGLERCFPNRAEDSARRCGNNRSRARQVVLVIGCTANTEGQQRIPLALLSPFLFGKQ